jgi:tetratricopeptide (TPR) repeat protein
MNLLKQHWLNYFFTAILLISIIPCKATEQVDFAAGLKAYDEKNFSEAEKLFREALNKKSNSTAIIYNLALSLIEQKKIDEARGYLRKAQLIEPNDDFVSQTLQQLNQSFPTNPIPQKLNLFESFRIHILEAVSINSFHYLFAFSFFVFCWLWLRVFSLKRKSKKLPWLDLVTVPVISISALFAFITAVYFSKIFLTFETRGILIVPSESVRLAADVSAAELLTLNAGLEFTVEQQQNEWLQITYAGTSTGWIKASSAMIISGDHHD